MPFKKGDAKPTGSGRQKGQRNKRTREIVEKASAEGITPLEVMLGAMRDAWEANDKDAAARFAKDAAPYIHPRLANIEHTGEDGGPVQHGVEIHIVDHRPADQD